MAHLLGVENLRLTVGSADDNARMLSAFQASL